MKAVRQSALLLIAAFATPSATAVANSAGAQNMSNAPLF